MRLAEYSQLLPLEPTVQLRPSAIQAPPVVMALGVVEQDQAVMLAEGPVARRMAAAVAPAAPPRLRALNPAVVVVAPWDRLVREPVAGPAKFATR